MFDKVFRKPFGFSALVYETAVRATVVFSCVCRMMMCCFSGSPPRVSG
jgi:hypothetical protein